MIKSNAIENEKVPTSPKYPYLGKSPKGTVVLFAGPDTGVCLLATCLTDGYEGEWSDKWTEAHFNKFDGVVELRND